MKVWIPGPLRSYTRERAAVEARGTTLRDILADLDRQFPGIRFRMIDEQDRIREHIRLFVELEQSKTLDASVDGADEIHIICALSGGA